MKSSCDLAADAEAIGAYAISVMPPSFFKPPNIGRKIFHNRCNDDVVIESLIQYVRAVAGSAPSLPIYYYHIPSMNGVDCKSCDPCYYDNDIRNYYTVPMEQLIDAHMIIPTLKGIKYTSLDLGQFSKCLTHGGGKMQMFYGCDEVCCI